MENIKNSVLNILGHGRQEDSLALCLHDARYKVCADEVHKVKEGSFGPIAFVDGGSALIADSASFCIGKIRVVACCFDSMRKHMGQKFFEAYVLCSYKDEKTLCTQIDIIRDDMGIDVSLLEVHVAVDDEEMVSTMTTLSPSSLLGKIRRLAELYAVCTLSGFVCLDGSLRWQDHLEKDVFSKIATLDVCGVCKTNSLITANYMVLELGGKGYKMIGEPLAKGIPTLFATKLHGTSKYTFVIESFNHVEQQISHLAYFADDPRFYGYPYGLIKADKLARVSNREIDREKAKMRVLFKDVWSKLEGFMHTQDAHDILDKIA